MRILDALEYLDLEENVLSHQLREDLAEFLETIEYMLLNTEFHSTAVYARNWRANHLDEAHLFDQFIQQKAFEINSGDHISDYFEALRMRRDQLLALRDVFKEYLNALSTIYSQDRDVAVDRMQKFNFEHGVFLRAQDYEKARKEVIHAHKNRSRHQPADDAPAKTVKRASTPRKQTVTI